MSGATYSVHEKAALCTSAETVVGVFVVRFICDHAVVAIFLWEVSHDLGS